MKMPKEKARTFIKNRKSTSKYINKLITINATYKIKNTSTFEGHLNLEILKIEVYKYGSYYGDLLREGVDIKN